jgi:hypothetical protein
VLIIDQASGSPHIVTMYGTGVLPPPPAPAALAAKAPSPQQVELTWTGGSPDVTAFAIWRKVGGGEFQRYSGVTGSVTRFMDRQVSANTTYTYRVRANGPGGISAWSNEATVTPRLPPPAAPTGLTVRALSPAQMELRWTDNSRDDTGFAIWRQSGGSDWARVGGVPTNITRFVDRNLAPSTSYRYRVRANGPGGISGWSNEATGTTLSASPGVAERQR